MCAHWQCVLQPSESQLQMPCTHALGCHSPTRRQLRKHKKEQERREFEALQEQGLNPYEVYRVRDAQAAAVAAAAQQAARQQQRKAEIAAALEAEARAHRKQIAKQEFDRQVR